MMEIVTDKNNNAMVVFTIGETIHITTLEKFCKRPIVVDARSPKFDGTFDQACEYVRTH